MFGKKFFSTVALGSATVGSVGSIANAENYISELFSGVQHSNNTLSDIQYIVDRFELTRFEFRTFVSNLKIALDLVVSKPVNKTICVNSDGFSSFKYVNNVFNLLSPDSLNAVIGSNNRVVFLKMIGTGIRVSEEIDIDVVRDALSMLDSDASVEQRIKFKI